MYLTLLEYRNMSISKTVPSPAQILFGRLKGHVPVREKLLNPCRDKTRIVSQRSYQEKQKFYYKRTAKDLPELNIGDKIMGIYISHIQWDNKKWKPG